MKWNPIKLPLALVATLSVTTAYSWTPNYEAYEQDAARITYERSNGECLASFGGAKLPLVPGMMTVRLAAGSSLQTARRSFEAGDPDSPRDPDGSRADIGALGTVAR